MLIRREARRFLERLLLQLKPDQREAVLLEDLEQLSIAEIAVVMEPSLASVKSLPQPARVTLYCGGQAYFCESAEG